jgi:hypothetical protein
MSLPVVAFRSGGVPEVVVHGETGLLAEEGDTEDLSRDLLALLENAELRDRMGRAGRRHVESAFDLKSQNAKLEAVYEEVLAGAPPPRLRQVPRSLGYLAGAPRVSTRPEAGLSGPRAHVLGVIRAFTRLGWQVRPFIAGDRVPPAWNAGHRSETALRSRWIARLAADLLRLALGVINGFRASREVGNVDWAYERFGSFQALGWWFRRKGTPWILETNVVFFLESAGDRKAVP